MKKHYLALEEIETPYQIIAIYTDEQDYRLAFLLNQRLNLQLKKSSSIIDSAKNTNFNVFEYENIELFQNWVLLNNHCFVESKRKPSQTFDLFSEKPTVFKQKKYYVNKYRKANYLLKIIAEEDREFIQKVMETIERIPQIYALELIQLSTIKNKKLLNF